MIGNIPISGEEIGDVSRRRGRRRSFNKAMAEDFGFLGEDRHRFGSWQRAAQRHRFGFLLIPPFPSRFWFISLVLRGSLRVAICGKWRWGGNWIDWSWPLNFHLRRSNGEKLVCWAPNNVKLKFFFFFESNVKLKLS